MKEKVKEYFDSFPVCYVYSEQEDLDYVAYNVAVMFNYVYCPSNNVIKYSFKRRTYVVTRECNITESNNHYIVVTNERKEHYVNLDSFIEPKQLSRVYTYSPYEIKQLEYSVNVKYKKILYDLKNLYDLYKYETNVSKYYGCALTLFIKP